MQPPTRHRVAVLHAGVRASQSIIREWQRHRQRGAELTTAFPHARPKLQRRSDERLILLAKFVDRGACLAWHSRPSKTKDLEVRNRHRQLSIRNNCPHLSQLCLQCLNPCLLLAANTFRLLQLRYSNSDTLASTRPSAGDAERWVLSRSITIHVATIVVVYLERQGRLLSHVCDINGVAFHTP